MSNIYGKDLDSDIDEDLLALEDPQFDNADDEVITIPQPLFRLKLEYSCEGLFATHDSEEFRGGEYVIISTRYGRDLALVMGKTNCCTGVRASDIVTIERRATESDLEKAAELRKKEEEAFGIFQQKVRDHKLEMKLISTHYLLEEQKVLFFFSSENRVDFRELVKDLVSVFKMRIELRQIGVRDESRITGGLGICGRRYCCHAVSDKLRPVSIRMAKDQNLSLNSMKISGQCGRLLCCLSYEHDWYNEARKGLPSEGVRFFYDGCSFRVTEVNPLLNTVKILGEDGRLLDISAANMSRVEGKWKVTAPPPEKETK
ncbi:MAG: hypothetical protein LBU99_01515 [Spirochaetaceae bacterium]|jgi:cell fate regulator YaaT (PSP1 superfamily)|nr:hypothetical protein [Spirochaetaceae bacterium]